jgi:hypothetical protein
MNINKEDLKLAAAKEGLTEPQAEALWNTLSMHSSPNPRMNLSLLLYYFGALFVISAMGWFITLGWDSFSPVSIFAIACIYALLFGFSGAYLWQKEHTRIPGGLLLTISVCMIPLALFALEKHWGFWPDSEDPGSYHLYFSQIKGSYLVMELGTIIGSLIMLYFFRFPFLTAPLFLSLWFMSLDIVPFLWGATHDTEAMHEWVSLCFGLLLLIISYAIDQRTKEDFAFWGYLFGAFSFWGALILLLTESSEAKFALFFFLNLVMIFKSIFLDRRILLILGTLGAFYYISHLATTIFEKSIFFPFVLSFIGVLIMASGILYSRYAKVIDKAIISIIPSSLQKFRPSSRK